LGKPLKKLDGTIWYSEGHYWIKEDKLGVIYLIDDSNEAPEHMRLYTNELSYFFEV
jgi:hypothetical protein